MNELKVNFENLTEEERAELIKLVEKANKPKSKAWKPEKDKRYYYIVTYDVSSCFCSNNGVDEGRYLIGNVFKTEEEALNSAERLKIRAELQRYADEHNDKPIDWEDDRQNKWSVYFNYEDRRLGYWYDTISRNPFQIYFSSEEIAKAAVQSVGEERIKKYLFGVEE